MITKSADAEFRGFRDLNKSDELHEAFHERPIGNAILVNPLLRLLQLFPTIYVRVCPQENALERWMWWSTSGARTLSTFWPVETAVRATRALPVLQATVWLSVRTACTRERRWSRCWQAFARWVTPCGGFACCASTQVACCSIRWL